MAARSTCSEPRRKNSCDTMCSSNSSCALQKRKTVHPLAASLRNCGSKSNPGSGVNQRVLSAKMLRFKNLQNQLNDANYHIQQLVNENKILKSLQKRQDNALLRYEGKSADLPRILESHEEEIRVLQTRNKNLRKDIKEMTSQLKVKDEELSTLRDQYRRLSALSKDRNLVEREKLTAKVEELSERLQESENTVSVLNRKLLLESKNFKHKLNAENIKYRKLQRDLQDAVVEISRMKSMYETKGGSGRKKSSTQQSVSMVALSEGMEHDNTPRLEHEVVKKDSDLPITKDMSSTQIESIIKKVHNDFKSETKLNELKRPTSKTNVENVLETWKEFEDDVDEKRHHIEKQLDDYRTDVVSSYKSCEMAIKRHNQNLQMAKSDTSVLMTVLKESDHVSTKLQNMKLDNPGDLELLEKILPGSKSRRSVDKPNDEDNQEVDFQKEDRKKLLNVLKAIDNGENVDTVPDIRKRKTNFIDNLFSEEDK